jgi:hypothetical protein
MEDNLNSRRRAVLGSIGAGIAGGAVSLGSATGTRGSAGTAVADPDIDPAQQGVLSWEVPTAETVPQSGIDAAISAVEDEVGVTPTAQQTENGVLFTAPGSTGTGEQYLLHPVLDVTESFLQNEYGKQGEGIVKSTLLAAGDSNGQTVQPSIELNGTPTVEQAQEIETLAALVLGVSVAVGGEETTNGFRVYIDTGVQALGHIAVDVSEIVSRRIAERDGLDVLDDDAHPIVVRNEITDGLGDNQSAGGPIDGTAGDPSNPYPSDGAVEVTDLDFDRPTDGDTRAAWHIPTGVQPTESDVQTLLDATENILGVRPTGTATDNGVLYEVDSTEFVHPLLDVTESVAANALGKPDVQGSVKSTLFVAGDRRTETLQPRFGLSEQFSDTAVAQIEGLFRLVAGVDSNAYHVEENGNVTFYIDPGTAAFSHLALDVAEILVRRFAAVEGVDVTDGFSHSLEARASHSRLSWEVPTAETVPQSGIDAAISAVEEEIGVTPTAEQTDNGVRLTAPSSTRTGVTSLLHPVLDVSESFLQNEYGKQGEGIVKSTLSAAGDASGQTVQPSIELSGTPTVEQAQEIETLAALVLGVSVAVGGEETANGFRVYIDTGVEALGHIAVDVSEIVGRRIAERDDLDVLDGDAHPIVVRDAVTDGLGDNQSAGGPIDGVAGDPSNPYPSDGPVDVTDLSFDRPTDGDTRAAWHIPTGVQPTESDVQTLLDATENILGVRPTGTATDNGVLYEVDSTEFVHPLLDVTESVAANALGKPDVQGSVKSTLFVAGDRGAETVQPRFGLSERFSDEAVAQIEGLYAFVAGVDANAYHVEENGNVTFYIDPGTAAFSHLALDVAEILVRRFAAVEGVDVTDGFAHSLETRVPGVRVDGELATDTTGDGLLNDVDGDGEFDIFDVQALFSNLDNEALQSNAEAFNFNEDGNPSEVTILDVQGLFDRL